MAFPCVDKVFDGEGLRTCTGLAYLDDYLYALYWGGWPDYNPKVKKLNPETYEKVGEWTAPYQACMAQAICTDCESIYVGTSNRGSTGHHWPLHVYKIDPFTMTTTASFQGYGWTGDTSAIAIQFDYKSQNLIVLDDRNIYRIWKLRQDLTEVMHKTAESGWPPSQWHGNDLTILGDHFFVATGGTPGEIVKRRTSDLEMVDWFEGTIDDPDYYIEGIFFNVCNDGEFVYTATYDYREERPMRVIQVNPEDMTQWNKYYGQSDEMMAYGSYAYGGRIYALLMGWNGIYWNEPGYAIGEVVVQINPDGMGQTDRYMNWTMDWNDAYVAIGDGSRLHVGFWGGSDVDRSILQFAEEGATRGTVGIGDQVAIYAANDKTFVERISTPAVGQRGMLANASDFKFILPKTTLGVGDSCKLFTIQDRSFTRKATLAHSCSIP